MNILVVSQYYFPEQFRVNDITAELVRRGHSVTVLTGQPNYPIGEIYKGYEKVADEIVSGVKIIRCKIRPRKTGSINLALNYLSFAISASKKLKTIKDDFDLIYVYQLSPVTLAIPAIIYKNKKNIPMFLYCLDIWPESIKDIIDNEKSIVFKAVKNLSRWIYNQADCIAVTSLPFIDYLISVCDVDKNKCTYIPQHAEEIDYVLCEKEVSEIVSFIYAGNVGLSQDLETVVEAVKLLKNKNSIMIHVVGDGSNLNKIKTMVSDYNLEKQIKFYGHQPIGEMIKFYSLSDVCILSLSKDSFVGMTVPGKLQGYMSAGKAVLGSISGPAKNVIEESNCGIVVEPGNPEKLSKAIEYFIVNKDKIKQYGINARYYFDNNYTLKKHVDSLENELNELV